MSELLLGAEWGDAVAAVRSCPGPPPPELVDRLITVGDAMRRYMTQLDAALENQRWLSSRDDDGFGGKQRS